MTSTEKAPWQERQLDIGESVVKAYLTAKAEKAAADAAFKQAEATLRYAMEEQQLDRFYDELSDSYVCPDVTFVRSERRSWPNECFSEELQGLIAAEKETREPKVSVSWRAVLKK
jgi:hypothetical protein